MDPATIMMIIQTMAKVAEASKGNPPQPGQAGGQAGPPPPNTAAQLMSARAMGPTPQLQERMAAGAAGRPSLGEVEERTKLQEIIDNTMNNPGVTPQLEQNLAKQQGQKQTLEAVEKRQAENRKQLRRESRDEALGKIAQGAEIGNTVRGMMPKPPSPSSMMNFGAAARSGPEPTSARFRRERASKLNDYVRRLLRGR